MPKYDTIVLGIGGVGSAALYELARRGVRAIGVDRFRPPHDRGSTHGQTRVIRQAYFEHPDYVPLLVESYRRWHELEQHVGQQLFHQIGLVEVGPCDGVVVPGVLHAAALHNLPVEQLATAEVSNRWPGLRVPDNFDVVFEPRAGYLLVEDCVTAHLAAAKSAGAELLTDTEVLDWTASGGEVRLRTDQGEIVGQRLILTAGAWASRIFLPRPLGEGWGEGNVPLEVRRKSLFWFETADAAHDVSAGMPVFLYELPAGVFYGFPKLDSRGVKVAEHTGGQTVDDPLAVDRNIDAGEQRRLTEFLTSYLPGVSPHVNDHSVCLYTMSPDEHFIVDRHPAHVNVAFAAGLSGHGFKFAPVLGRALADLAIAGHTDLPIGFLSLARFK